MCTFVATIRSSPSGEFLKQIRFRTGPEERMEIIGRGAGGSRGASYGDFLGEVAGYVRLGALIEMSTQPCDAARENDWFGVTPCAPKEDEEHVAYELVSEVSPTESAELGVWLRALPHRTILTDRDGNACQIDTGEEHIHRAPNRHFRALCLGGHPYEISEGHEEIEALAKWSGPFTVLKRGALAESSGDAA